MPTASVKVNVWYPRGATHYNGNVAAEPAWFKRDNVGGVTVWARWDYARKTWVLYGYEAPRIMNKLEDIRL